MERVTEDLEANNTLELINKAIVTFQGHEIKLKDIIDDESVKYITKTVINKVDRKEMITIGEPLTDRNYEEVKHSYVDRRLCEIKPLDFIERNDQTWKRQYCNEVHTVTTFDDINANAVLIIAGPGAGKSTLLTHLLLNTKQLHKDLWIVRINLIDHAKAFYKWQQEKTSIDSLKILKFICQVLSKDNTLSLKRIDDKVYLEESNFDELAMFELNMFLNCYNNGKSILLIDGFDAIYPNYKETALQFLNEAKNLGVNKLWVTTRPYNNILEELKDIFDKSYEIEYFNDEEQRLYLNKVWKSKMKVKELSNNMLDKVKAYLDYGWHHKRQFLEAFDEKMNFRFRKIIYHFHKYLNYNFPHYEAYESDRDSWDTELSDYDSEISDTDGFETESANEEENNTETRDTNTSTSIDPINNTDNTTITNEIRNVDKQMGTPSFLYSVAEYLVSVLDESDDDDWLTDINIYTFYEILINHKLKQGFQSKIKLNSNLIYENERTETINLYKKLATYAVFGNPLKFEDVCLEEFKDLLFKDTTELISMIDKIKSSADKTGIISHVTSDNIPVFSRTFAEFFAAEYICDIYRDSNIDFGIKKLLYITLEECYQYYDTVPAWMSEIKKKDEVLKDILDKIYNDLPFVKNRYNGSKESYIRDFFNCGSWPKELLIRLLNSSLKDYEADCFEEHVKYCFFNTVLKSGIPREDVKKEFAKHVMTKMKPHLKKHFVGKVETTLE